MSKSRVAERSAAYALQAAVEPAFGTSFDLLATAPQGVAKLRELILSLAFRGRLLPQGSNGESALDLLLRVRAEKERLVKAGVISSEKFLEAVADTEVDYELPEGWAWARLPELYFSISPGRKKLPTSAIRTHGPIPVVDQGKSYIAGYTDDASLKLQLPGPVIIFGDHTTEVKYVDFDFVAGADGVKILRPVLQNEKYFFLQLSAFKLESRGYARHFKVLNSKMFAVAPLAEQARIVARVEELMQLCDALEAHGRLQDEQHARLVATLFDALAASASAKELADNWQRIATHFDLLLDRPEAVDALEQTLLQLAVRGLLVQQDPTDEPASKLLARIRAEKDRLVAAGQIKRDKPLPPVDDVEKPFKEPDTWEWIRFGTVVNDSEAGWSPSCDAGPRQGDTWGVLKVSAVSWGEFRSRENKQLPTNLEPRQEYEVHTGDFLISRANTAELVARSVVAKNPESKLMLSDKIIRLDISELADRDFFNMANNAQSSRDYYAANASGTSSSMKNVGRQVILNMPVAIPPLAEQHRIVARVEQLRRLCADLRERLQQARSTQSRLADALVSAAAQSPTC